MEVNKQYKCIQDYEIPTSTKFIELNKKNLFVFVGVRGAEYPSYIARVNVNKAKPFLILQRFTTTRRMETIHLQGGNLLMKEHYYSFDKQSFVIYNMKKKGIYIAQDNIKIYDQTMQIKEFDIAERAFFKSKYPLMLCTNHSNNMLIFLNLNNIEIVTIKHAQLRKVLILKREKNQNDVIDPYQDDEYVQVVSVNAKHKIQKVKINLSQVLGSFKKKQSVQ